MWKALRQTPKLLMDARMYSAKPLSQRPKCADICMTKPKVETSKYESLMDYMMIPEGCWHERDKKLKQKCNVIFMLGILNFILVCVGFTKVGFIPGNPEIGPLEHFWEWWEEK